MGYTHYWQKTTQEITDEQWNEFKKFVSELINTVNDGTTVHNAAGGTSGTVVIKDGCGEDEPIITDEFIAFNGDASQSLAHESVYIKRVGDSGFNFCKTARKPYDPVVIACILEAERLGIFTEWSSDGDDAEHQGGFELYEQIADQLS